jgi:hypothetical protein
LNYRNALPWSTNGKHCTDRSKLLVANFCRKDRALSSASGFEEENAEKDQLLADVISAIDKNEERGRLERDMSARIDKRIAKAGQEVRASAMKRRTGDRSEVDWGNSEDEEEGSLVPPSHDCDGATTPTDSRRGRNQQEHSALELEDVLV